MAWWQWAAAAASMQPKVKLLLNNGKTCGTATLPRRRAASMIDSTTSGSGSEASKGSVVTDNASTRKSDHRHGHHSRYGTVIRADRGLPKITAACALTCYPCD